MTLPPLNAWLYIKKDYNITAFSSGCVIKTEVGHGGVPSLSYLGAAVIIYIN